VRSQLEFVRVAVMLETKNVSTNDLKIDNGDGSLEFEKEHLQKDSGVQELQEFRRLCVENI